MTTVFIGLFSLAVHAAPAADVARLFRVTKDGRASYVLANLDAYRLPVDAEVEPLRRAIAQSCEFVLTLDPRQKTPLVAIPEDRRFQRPLALLDTLSPEAIRTLTHLIRATPQHLDYYLSMRPGVALQFLKQKFIAERQPILDGYHRAIVLGESQPAARLHSDLLEAARELWGKHVTAHGVLTNAFHYLIERERRVPEAPSQSLDAFLIANAGDPRVTTLATRDQFLNELDLITAADLERFLMSVRHELMDLSEDSFWDSVLIVMLNEELTHRFFTMPTRRFAYLVDLINSDQPTANELLTGEESRRLARANVHENWTPKVLNKIDAGGAFVSLGAGYVLPGLEPLTRRPLLEELKARGYAVDPVTWSP